MHLEVFLSALVTDHVVTILKNKFSAVQCLYLPLIRKFVIETTKRSPVGMRLNQFPYFPN